MIAKEQIKMANEKKLTVAQIAKKYNVAKSTARYWLDTKMSEKDMEYRRQRLYKTKEDKTIEGVPLEDLARVYKIKPSTARSYWTRKFTILQIEAYAQSRNGVPLEDKTICGRKLSDISDDIGVPEKAIFEMAKRNVPIKDMPAYMEKHGEKLMAIGLKKKNPSAGRKKDGTKDPKYFDYDAERKKLADKNNVMLARKL